MNFRLVYRGPLPSNGSPKEKQAIRRQIHPQLAELWAQPPLKELAGGRNFLEDTSGEPGKISLIVTRGNFTFVPLVTSRLALICQLDILFLRPGVPGSLIQHGGDLDNRLKTLFDALQIPDENQLRAEAPQSGETPFFCLMENDALITRFAVEADRLLEPAEPGIEPGSRVQLVLNVSLKATQLWFTNIELVN